jgi:hypothetical protein
VEEEKRINGSITKTTNITCPPGQAASTPGTEIATTGCLSAVQEAPAFTSCLPELRHVPQSAGIFAAHKEKLTDL